MSTPSTSWKETIEADEDARFQRYSEQLNALQKKRARGGKASRALHAKPQAGVLAELRVLGDLPEHLRHGLFAEPATYRAYVRFSNGAGVRQPDKKPDVRGVAIKILGVKGKKVIPGMEDAPTQDLLLIHTPDSPFRNPDDFITFVLAAESPALLPFKVIGHFGFGRGVAMIKQLLAGLSKPVLSAATTQYFSTLPSCFGPYASKLTLVPLARDAGMADGKTADDLGEELAARLREGAISYDLRAQFYVDDTKTPIEDASVRWQESDAPFETVARLTLLKQDVASAKGKRVAEFIEGLSFDPWHTLVEHRPLGAMMRARNVVYRLSTKERGAAGEPDGSEHFD